MTDQDKDHEERAFTGHSDHPPSEPDQSPEANREVVREGGESSDAPEGEPEEGKSPGDQGTNLPGYG